MKYPTIACVFPIHNEASILKTQLTAFRDELKRKRVKIDELILVENGSRDRSLKIITTLARSDKTIKVIHLDQASYGQAIKAGIEKAASDIIFVFNIDFFDVDFMLAAIPLLEVADIVVASKTLAASQDQRQIYRRLLTYFFNAFLRVTLNYPGTDTHGVKVFRNTRLLQYALKRCRTRHELVDTEVIIRMTRWGAKIVELPTTVREVRPTRYVWTKRIAHTLMDLVTAFWAKYLIPQFSNRFVVADDFGLSARVNQTIIEWAKSGAIHVVSIMANFVSPHTLRPLKEKHLPIRYSVHLNLVQGVPVSPLHRVPTLVNARGHFYPTVIFFWRLLLGRVNIKEIELEFDQQIKTLEKQGIRVSHIDSHQHWHLFPPIWNIVIKLARRWKIDEVRSFDSARYALLDRPWRYLAFWAFYVALRLRYGKNQFSTVPVDEIIVHPGGNVV